jgi:hypothetical protein
MSDIFSSVKKHCFCMCICINNPGLTFGGKLYLRVRHKFKALVPMAIGQDIPAAESEAHKSLLTSV